MAKGDENKVRGYPAGPKARAAGAQGYVKKKGGWGGKRADSGKRSTMAAPQAAQRPTKVPPCRRSSSVPPREGRKLVTPHTRGALHTRGGAAHDGKEVAENAACTSLMSMHVPYTYTSEDSTIARPLSLPTM